MNEAEKLCENFRSPSRIIKPIQAHNLEKPWQPFDEIPENLLDNCDNCAKYWRLMFMKVCFRYRLRYRLKFLFWRIITYAFTHRLRIVEK